MTLSELFHIDSDWLTSDSVLSCKRFKFFDLSYLNTYCINWKKLNLHSCQDFCLRSDRFCVRIPRFAFFIFRARKYFTHLFKFHDFLRSPTYSLYKAYNSELYTIWGKVNKTITFSLNPKTILIRIKGYWYKMKRVLWEYFPKVFPGHVSCDKWSWSFWFWGFSNFCRACWPKLFCPSQKKVTNEAF